MSDTCTTMAATNISSSKIFTVDRNLIVCLYNNRKFVDVDFIVGKERQHISAHKLILSASSPVFEAMFYGSLAAKSDKIEIPDVEPAAFSRLLKFLYSNEVQICPETVMATLYVANKYDVATLVALCLEIVDKNTLEVLTAESFTKSDLGILIFVLERDTLQVYESKLFQAIILWSKAECARKELFVTPENQRSVLGGALMLVRFSLMTFKEFVSGPVESGLLDNSEAIKFCKDIVASNTMSIEVPRCSKTSFEYHLKFYHGDKNILGLTCFTDCFTFRRPVVIVGIVLHPYIIKYKSNVVLTFMNEKEDSIRFPISQCNNSSVFYDVLPMMFFRPIVVVPNTDYKVEIQFEELSDIGQYEMQSDGIICGYDGHKLEDMKLSDYFTFNKSSGIISEIIFYDLK